MDYWIQWRERLINNIYDAESDNKLDDVGNDLLKNDSHVSTLYI